MTAERSYRLFRCRDSSVAFDSVYSGNAVYQLELHGMCPLCGTPVAEHKTFTLVAAPDGEAGESG